MNILATIILLIAFSKLSDQDEELGIAYEILPYLKKPPEGLQIPADLMSKMYNKTEEDLAYEDCMESFTSCMIGYKARTDDNGRICAIDKRNSSKRSFETICEMIYENCKSENATWGYFHDGKCKVEFVEDPEKLPSPEPTKIIEVPPEPVKATYV